MALELTTMLEAINSILASVGESPINSVDDADGDAADAKRYLIEEMRAAQTPGWHWNTDNDVDFAPDNAGYISLPTNILRLVFEDKDIVKRGTRLYNRTDHTYVFTATQTATEVVTLLPFDEMPEPLRRFVMIRAGRRFQDQTNSDRVLHEFQVVDERIAWTSAQNEEAKVMQYNVLSHPNNSLVQRIRGNR